jgi:hypothetical protein
VPLDLRGNRGGNGADRSTRDGPLIGRWADKHSQEQRDAVIRARAFLDREAKALSEEPEQDGARLRLLIRWTGDLLV